jgi:hypothetical protein
MLQAIRWGWSVRTFKREVAVALLAFWMLITSIMTARIAIFTTDAATITAIGAAWGPMYSSITTMVITFAGFAFGLDAVSKQLGMGASKE